MSHDPPPPTPPRRRASDFPPEVLRLFDAYVHGGIDRRGFLEGASKFAVGGVTAAGLLEALSPRFAEAQQVAPNDARIRVESILFNSPQGYGKGRAYVARPARAEQPLPVVLVAHENRGLNPHIEDVARRLALANFIAFAPDALYPLGGYPGNEDRAREMFAQLDQAKTREDFVAATAAARTLDGGSGRIGGIGFCWGGGMVNVLAQRVPELQAGVVFYGNAPPLGEVGAIKAKLLFIFADRDERINATWPAYEAALQAAGVPFQAYRYPGTEHGFHNDTTPRYDQAAARQAWERAVSFLDRTLRGA